MTVDSLGNLALREIAREWDCVNRDLFGGAMRRPSFLFLSGTRRLGQWNGVERSIALNRSLLDDQSWGVVLEVLRHEMAHQFVFEVMGVRDQTPHGLAFRQVCDRFGIDPQATGVPQDNHAVQPRAIRRIRGLMALAESSNLHEAESAMKAAHRLMRRHNISWSENGAEDRQFRFQQLGTPSRRVPAHERILSAILAQHFFVQCVWVHAFDVQRGFRGRVLEVCGAADNLAIAAHAYTFLLNVGESLWKTQKVESGITHNRWRRRFLSGVMCGFLEKLDLAARACESEGLVWLGDPRLKSYVERRHPVMRAGRATRVPMNTAWEQGRAKGKSLVLHRVVAGSRQRKSRVLLGRK